MEIGSVTDDWDWESLDICGCFEKDTDAPSDKIDFEERVAPPQSTNRSPEMPSNISIMQKYSGIASKVTKVALGDVLAAWELEAGANLRWGGKEGVEYKFHLDGNVNDDNGNYGGLRVEQNGDGTGSASVSGGHKDTDSSDKS